MSRPSDLALLRQVYRSLDLDRFAAENPSITRAELQQFFRRLAQLLPEEEPGGAAPPAQVFVYSDGASRGNPGDAGIGVVITDAKGKVLLEECAPAGRRTNNAAEYLAAVRGLEQALELRAQDVTLRSDSELLIRQVRGEYRVRDRALAQWHAELMALAGKLSAFRAEHVPRERNLRADALAKDAALTGREHCVRAPRGRRQAPP